MARESGLFEEHGIQPKLVDTSLVPPDAPPSTPVSVALGSALMSWLTGEERYIEVVSCARPMFQLCVHQFDPRNLSELTSATLASYPGPAPPSRFFEFLLTKRGKPDESPEFVEARTDASRLGLLVMESVDAALVSSKIPPPRLDRMGLSTADWLGEHLRIPTTGLATTPEGRRELGDHLDDLVKVFHRAHRRIHGQPETAINALTTYLGLTEEEARGTLASIQNFYTQSGTVSLDDIRHDVKEFAQFMDRPLPGPLKNLYARTDS